MADILELDLGWLFDVVLAGSNLVNSPAPDGDRFIEVAAHHVSDRGAVLVEVYPPDLDWAASVGRRSEVGPVGITVRSAVIDGDRLDAVVAYDLDGRSWEQPFSARLLDEPAVRRVVAAAGLAFDRWLDEPAGWFRAVRDTRREAAT